VDDIPLVVTQRQVSLLLAGLRSYVRAFSAHREVDGGASHPEEEWDALRREVGHLIWTLEVAGTTPGATLLPSPEAVPPDA
jgi:hypothetical protein